MSPVHNEILVRIKHVKEHIDNLNVDQCVKLTLLDEVNKAEYFINQPEQRESLERLAMKHINNAKTLVISIKRHQRMIEDQQS